MATVRVIHDRKGETLTVWFGNHDDEFICEETAEEVILMKDRSGNVIGFEKLHYRLPASREIAVEALTA